MPARKVVKVERKYFIRGEGTRLIKTKMGKQILAGMIIIIFLTAFTSAGYLSTKYFFGIDPFEKTIRIYTFKDFMEEIDGDPDKLFQWCYDNIAYSKENCMPSSYTFQDVINIGKMSNLEVAIFKYKVMHTYIGINVSLMVIAYRSDTNTLGIDFDNNYYLFTTYENCTIGVFYEWYGTYYYQTHATKWEGLKNDTENFDDVVRDMCDKACPPWVDVYMEGEAVNGLYYLPRNYAEYEYDLANIQVVM